MKCLTEVVAALLLCGGALAAVQCNGIFSPITGDEWVKKVNPGWNLGNTLDALPNEGSWNNPPVKPETFDQVKKAGFKSVRLPVTWTTKIGPAPNYTVQAAWLERVSTVLDQITARGLHALVNVHHDSWEWLDWTSGASTAELERKFARVWAQIGAKLACKSSMVAFEPLNEAKGSTREHADVMNRMNAAFLKAINEAGGFNPQRLVNLVGLGEDGPKTSQWFKKPAGAWKNPWAIQYHYYSPYDFVFSAWGKTTWGSPSDIASLTSDLALVRGNFTSTPLAIGEFAASPAATEAAARWRWFDAVGRAARATNTAVFLWDNGADFLDRRTGAWRDGVAIEVLKAALRGDANSLPDAETDPKATSQWSSATAFKKVGDRVEAQKLPFLLNGNRVLGVAREGGAALVAGRDYSVGSADGAGRASITLTAPFLEGAYRASGAAGVAANLTVRFSRGAASRVQVAQWERPRFTAGGQASSKAKAGADLTIPIRWGGVQKVAAVKAVYADGEFLADDWTKYLGPLQAGYATYNNHYAWTADAVVLKKSVVDMVVAKRKKAVFTFDFFPRVPGNSLTYTLNP